MANELRRPIASRQSAWASAIARWLAKCGVRPNVISVFSCLFAGIAGISFAMTSQVDTQLEQNVWLIVAILGIQLRLLCNLFDGMVAIEEGQKTASGALFNELPDRFSDAFILVGAGYAASVSMQIPELGWLAAVLAVMTAYVRALGGSIGAQQQFVGPMAKQHRMALVTFASVVTIVLNFTDVNFPVIHCGLVLVSLGCFVTIFRRTQRVIRELEAE